MNCEQAKNLFDAHLNGELSPTLETELAAHRLACAECRHELALMEVAGHVIATGRDDSVDLAPEFTDRLLACVETPQPPTLRIPLWLNRRVMAGGGLLAAAASVVIAFNMWFGDPGVRIAGEKVYKKSAVKGADIEVAADSMVRQVQTNVRNKANGAQLLMEMGQVSFEQLLHQLQSDTAVDAAPLRSAPSAVELKVSSDLEIEEL